MPTYEYLCRNGHDFEKFQKMSDKPRAKCPVCGVVAERLISKGAGLVFKGSGFYITDYGKDGKGPRKAESESAPSTSGTESAPAAESKAEPKTETKKETKAESKTSDSKPAKPKKAE